MRIGVDADEIRHNSDALLDELVPPPAPTVPSVCTPCLTWAPQDVLESDGHCENCEEVASALRVPPVPLTVISLYRKPSLLRDWMTRYKGRPDAPEDALEPAYVEVVRAMLGRFLLEHGATLAASCHGIDGLVVVPSTEARPQHPLEAVIGTLDVDVPLLKPLRRGQGELAFRKPGRDGYEAIATPEEHARRVLLVDDVYTTGSRLNSAAYRLTEAGFEVAGALVMARRINPDYNDHAKAFWDAQSSRHFTWATGPTLAASAPSQHAQQPQGEEH